MILTKIDKIRKAIHEAEKPNTLSDLLPLVSNEISYIKRLLKKNKIQLKDTDILLFSVICYVAAEESNSVFISNIRKLLNVSVVTLHLNGFTNSINLLRDHGLITISKRSRGEVRLEISLTEEVYMAVLTNCNAIGINRDESELNVMTFFVKAKTIIDNVCSGYITLKEARAEAIKNGLQSAEMSSLVKFLVGIEELDNAEFFMVVFCVFSYIEGEPKYNCDDLIDEMFCHDFEKIYNFKKKLLHKNSKVIINEYLIPCENDTFKHSLEFELTDKIKNILHADDQIAVIEHEDKNLISVKENEVPDLYYNESTLSEIDTITNTLRPENFESVLDRMRSANLNTAFCIAISGVAGGGKSSIVRRIAALTSRKIYKVNLSNFRSQFYGASEKAVIEQFQRYFNLKDKNTILLIEEMDGLFQKRLSDSKGAADSTDNRIQNILLDQIENMPLGSVLIGTCNDPSFMNDEAYRRRFLYHLQIDKPNFDTRLSIAESYLKGYSDEFYRSVALNETLTGGLIANLSKRLEIEKILGGDVAESQILEWVTQSSSENYGVKRVEGFRLN